MKFKKEKKIIEFVLRDEKWDAYLTFVASGKNGGRDPFLNTGLRIVLINTDNQEYIDSKPLDRCFKEAANDPDVDLWVFQKQDRDANEIVRAKWDFVEAEIGRFMTGENMFCVASDEEKEKAILGYGGHDFKNAADGESPRRFWFRGISRTKSNEDLIFKWEDEDGENYLWFTLSEPGEFFGGDDNGA